MAENGQIPAMAAERVRRQPVQLAAGESSGAIVHDIHGGSNGDRQPVNLFNLMTPQAQARVMDYIADAMQDAPMDVVRRRIAQFYEVNPAYGIGVATRLGLPAAGGLPFTTE